jgi:Flp pilus assembly protein TadG
MQGLCGRAYHGFKRNEGGASAMVFALFLPVLMLMIGGAIDLSRMVQLRGQLQDAADAASVGSVGVTSAAFQAGISMSSDGNISAGSSQAQAIFASDMTTPNDLSAPTVTTAVAKVGTTITSVITVKANYKSAILGLFAPSMASLPITVTSTSSSTMPPYMNFYLLLDNTPSMGLGATPSDIGTLQANTPAAVYGKTDANCAFACHETDKPSSGIGEDYYHLARDLKVTLRIDVVRQATQNLMTTATNTETLPNQYGMAIYDFGNDATKIDAQAPTPYLISKMQTTLSQSAQDAGTIDLMTVPKQNYNNDEQTNFTSMLKAMSTTIPASGSGMTPASPQEVLFLVSDGVNDGYDCGYTNGYPCRRIQPIDTTSCTALKNNGVRIAVLYTTYQPVPSDSFFTSWVQPLLPIKQLDGSYSAGKVATSMQACASPGLYFEVSPTQGISDAMNALFKKVVSVVRINS